MSRSILAVLILSFSAAAVAKHVYPQNLKRTKDGTTYNLAENYVFTEKAATFTLFAGSYVQKFEDSKALYLIGNSNCLEMRVVPPKNPSAAWADKWDCGILLPRDSSKGAAFFMIRRTPGKKHDGNGLIIDAIINAGYGSFDFPTSRNSDMALRGRLTQTSGSKDAARELDSAG